MPKCAVKKCKNYTLKVQKKDGVSYFHFPQNEIQREKWRCIIAQERENEFYKPNASSVICSEHFNEDDIYLTKKGFKRILKTAIPNIKSQDVKADEGQIAPHVVDLELPSTSRDFTNYLKMECIKPAPIPKIIQVEETETGKNNIVLPANSESLCTASGTSTLRMECINTSIPNKEEECGSFQIKAPPIVNSPSTSLSLGSILDSPRKASLRKELRSCKKKLFDKNKKVKNLHKNISRLKKKNASLKSTIAVLRKLKDLDESVICNLSSHVEVKDTFNALFLKNIKNKKRPFSKYPPGARKFALTLNFYSPAAYRYIRKILKTAIKDSDRDRRRLNVPSEALKPFYF